jgi:hypothetical protein
MGEVEYPEPYEPPMFTVGVPSAGVAPDDSLRALSPPEFGTSGLSFMNESLHTLGTICDALIIA